MGLFVKHHLLSLLAGLTLLLSAAPAAHAQPAPNGCELTPADTSKVVLQAPLPSPIMLAHVTDTCPANTYLGQEYVQSGMYDGTQYDYLRAGSVVKTPQLTDEILVLIPSSNDYFWSNYGAGHLSLRAGGIADRTDDQKAAWTRAESYYFAVAAVVKDLASQPADTTPPFARWQEGKTKDETAADAYLANVAPRPDWAAPDGCQNTYDYLSATVTRIVRVSDTCTKDTFGKVAEPGIANWQVGGSQFVKTAPTNSPLWLLYATYKADDGSEVLGLLMKPWGTLGLQISAPNTADLLYARIKATPTLSTKFDSSAPLREYYLTWLPGQPTPPPAN